MSGTFCDTTPQYVRDRDATELSSSRPHTSSKRILCQRKARRRPPCRKRPRSLVCLRAAAPGVMSRKRHFSQNTWGSQVLSHALFYSLAFARTKINTPDPNILELRNTTVKCQLKSQRSCSRVI